MQDITGKRIRKLYVNIGASRNHQGNSSISVAVRDNYGRTLEELQQGIGKTAYNEAVYLSGLKALEISAKYCRNIVYIFTDSQLLVNHVSGRYRVRKKELLRLLLDIKLLEGLFNTVRFFHVDRSLNTRAVRMAKDREGKPSRDFREQSSLDAYPSKDWIAYHQRPLHYEKGARFRQEQTVV
jgi:ribonuclease HI